MSVFVKVVLTALISAPKAVYLFRVIGSPRKAISCPCSADLSYVTAVVSAAGCAPTLPLKYTKFLMAAKTKAKRVFLKQQAQRLLF